MKIRVRVNSTTVPVELFAEGPGKPLKLEDLRRAIASKLQLSSANDLHLSLNNKDELAFTDDPKTLAELKIFGGDLLYVLSAIEPTVIESLSIAQPSKVARIEPTSQETSSASLKGSSRVSAVVLLMSQIKNDWEVPDGLRIAYTHSPPHSPHQALVIALHILLVESGFTSVFQKENKFILPENWQSDASVMVLRYQSEIPSLTVLVKCVSLGSFLLVHAFIEQDQNEQIYLSHFNINNFIRLESPLTSDPSRVYKDLKAFSRSFKDQVSYPLRARCYALEGRAIPQGLQGLLPELKLMILSFLDYRSLCQVAQTCRQFREVAMDSTLWKRLCRVHNWTSDIQTADWRLLFRDKIREERQRAQEREQYQQFIAPPQPSFILPDSTPFTPPIAPFAGGHHFIGGDYDRIPGGFPSAPGGFYPRPPFNAPDYGPGIPPGSVPPGARFDPIGPSFDPRPPLRGPQPSFGDPFGPTFGGSSGLRRPGRGPFGF